MLSKSRSKPGRSLSLAAAACLIATSLAAPCDIYALGGTPCVAAHSTTRILFDFYYGPMYQVVRGSDGATMDILPLWPGGIANAAAQDTFCARTTCLISIIYDQSSKGNHLKRAPRGAFSGPEADGSDNLASAIGAPVKIQGQKVYGVFISPGTGYRNNAAKGIPVKDQPQGIYAVLDGTHYNGGCCFDYGNAEVNSTDTGNGHMEALYFGNINVWGTGSGPGPWIMADMENGLFSGQSPKNNPADPTISYRFVTAVVKGMPNHWAIRGGNARNSRSLATFYNGPRPTVPGYNLMSKEGAIILGIGGDNSVGAQGTLYEAVITFGYPSDATEDAVQANIAAADYTTASLNSGPRLRVQSSISFQVDASTRQYISHSGSSVDIAVVSSSSSTALKKRATWIIRTGLGFHGCYSFESASNPGSFLRHQAFEIVVGANDGSKAFAENATFCAHTSLKGEGSSIRSWNYPTRFLRSYNKKVYAASNGGPKYYETSVSYNEDASWVVCPGLA